MIQNIQGGTKYGLNDFVSGYTYIRFTGLGQCPISFNYASLKIALYKARQ